VSEDPPPPSRLVAAISPDLDAIVAKALAKEPAMRYQSAADLAADVERFHEGSPVIARPPSRWYLQSRFCSRNKLAMGLAAALIAEAWEARSLREKLYCQRGEMENRIKEQISVFAERLSTETMRSNQLRLYRSNCRRICRLPLRKPGTAVSWTAD